MALHGFGEIRGEDMACALQTAIAENDLPRLLAASDDFSHDVEIASANPLRTCVSVPSNWPGMGCVSHFTWRNLISTSVASSRRIVIDFAVEFLASVYNSVELYCLVTLTSTDRPLFTICLGSRSPRTQSLSALLFSE